MQALAVLVKRTEREQWRKKFGPEFTGMQEGRPVAFAWHERTVGHVCVGGAEFDGHLHCMRMVQPAWVWLRKAK